MYRLLVNPGSPHAWELPLRAGSNSIGRDSEADFVIDHGSLSSVHCEIDVTPEGMVVRDLGSTNGTFVNDRLVRESQLRTGDTLQLGSIGMLVEELSAERPEGI